MVDESKSKELLGWGEAVDSATMCSPIDEVDDALMPLGMLVKEVFSEAAGTKGVAESIWDGLCDGNIVVVESGLNSGDGRCVAIDVGNSV